MAKIETVLLNSAKRLGGVKLLNKLGVNNYAQSLYWKSIKYVRLSGEKKRVRINDTTTTFDIDTYEEFRHVYEPTEEKEVLRTALQLTDSDTVFYDIGAHIGLFSCMIGSKIVDGSVHSFEPNPLNCEKLHINGEENSISDHSVHQIALGDTKNEVVLEPSESVVGSSGSVRQQPSSEDDGIEVKQRVGDKYVKDKSIPSPDLIKIDVQGMETRVIKGLHETIEESEDLIIIVEAHSYMDKYGDSKQDLLDLLNQLGFEVEAIGKRSQSITYKAVK